MAAMENDKAVQWFFDWWKRAVPELLPWDDAKIRQWLDEQERNARESVDWFLHESPAYYIVQAIMHECGCKWSARLHTDLQRAIEQVPSNQECYIDRRYDWAAARGRIQRILEQHGRRLYDEPAVDG